MIRFQTPNATRHASDLIRKCVCTLLTICFVLWLITLSIGGGTNFWTVYLTGTNLNVAHIGDSSDSSPKPSAKASADASPTPKTKEASVPPSPSQTKDAPATIITKGTTIVVTAPGETNAKATAPVTTEKASKGPNTAGIAAGTVVGFAALCAIAGGLFFFLRNRRRRRAQEDNYSRSNENPFNTNNLPSSAASMSDSRLEPSVMMQRRQSDGSIADNQDYSRRILKVAKEQPLPLWDHANYTTRSLIPMVDHESPRFHHDRRIS